METRIRIFLQSTLILVALGIGVQVSAQPKVITEVPANSTGFVSIGDLVYFTAGDQLWRTDGTAGGTILLESGFVQPAFFTEFNGAAYFTNANNSELWKSDGTPSGTIQLHTSGDNNLRIVGQSDNTLFFQSYDAATGLELYRTNGTAGGTMLVKDINPGPSDGFAGFAAVAGNALFFAGDDGTSGRELWKSDGSSGGTVMVEDINPGAADGFDSRTIALGDGDFYYFSGVTPASGAEPWVSDGSAEGTFMLAEVIPGSDGPIEIQFRIAHDGVVYFLAHYSDGFTITELWRSSGTTESTRKIREVGGDNSFHSFLVYNDKIAFFDFIEPYHYLWISDGTTEGTETIFALHADNSVDYFDVVNDHLLFVGTDQGLRTYFYRSDGTEAGTEPFTEFRSYRAAPERRDVTTVGDFVFFADHVGAVDEGGNPINPADYFHLFQANGFTSESMRRKYDMSTIGTDNIVDLNGIALFTTAGESGATGGGILLWMYDPEDANTGPGVECTASGSILREYWDGVQGSRVSDIPLNSEPSQTSQLSIFEGPTNAGTHYGARIHGYICPPQTGDYVFWIASNDHSELWLSTDGSTANKVKIAYVEGATGSRQWDKFASQKSRAISLSGGQRYYIMALHKQGVGSDNLAVGWQLPDGTLERPISGSRLSPFDGATTNRPTVTLLSPEEGDTFTAPATVVIEAEIMDVDGMSNSVEFLSNSEIIAEFTEPPYRFTWTDVPEGAYSIVALSRNSDGSVSYSPHVNITVGSGCMASGTITREYWSGVQGSQVSDVPVNSPPTSVSDLTIFEGPSNVGPHYGSRIRGYICPPETGRYFFYISSNDHSELWLSTDDNPENKVRIAYVRGATGVRQWNKYTSQQSSGILLTEGERYYIEAVHKQGVGSDNLAVGWELPSGDFERPIPGSRLSPFEMNDAARMASAVQEDSRKETSYSQISIYPNPVERGTAELRMSGYESISESVETQVEIINLTGEVVYAERVRCGGDCGTYLMNINEELMPGVYMVNMRTNGARFSKRLLVK